MIILRLAQACGKKLCYASAVIDQLREAQSVCYARMCMCTHRSVPAKCLRGFFCGESETRSSAAVVEQLVNKAGVLLFVYYFAVPHTAGVDLFTVHARMSTPLSPSQIA